jgi:hypothetical protein
MPTKRIRLAEEPDILMAVQELAGDRTRTAADIYRELERRPDFQGRLPSERTIEREVGRVRAMEGGAEYWTATDYSGVDARLVLDVLDAVIKELEGRVVWFTKAQAQRILHIARVAPGLKPGAVLQAALLRITFDLGKWDTRPFDIFLAMAPWR